jgi:CheY-like chemotaxis protein
MADLLEGLRCLLVDDDREIVVMIESLLRAIGITKVSTASNGTEAVAILTNATQVVDLTICDLDMPNGNGLQLLHAIRSGQLRNVRPNCSFIVLTAFASPPLIALAGKLDANGYLIKPVTADKLRDAITKARSRVLPPDPAKYAYLTIPDRVS